MATLYPHTGAIGHAYFGGGISGTCTRLPRTLRLVFDGEFDGSPEDASPLTSQLSLLIKLSDLQKSRFVRSPCILCESSAEKDRFQSVGTYFRPPKQRIEGNAF